MVKFQSCVATCNLQSFDYYEVKFLEDSYITRCLVSFLIKANQLGFKPGDSCINQLLSITHNIYKSFDDGYEVRGVFLDISKAFDKVCHNGLIFKIQKNGTLGNLLKVLKHFLTNGKQRIVLNGQSSSWTNIKAGVLQGSILGPLLFLIYINDFRMVYPLILSFLLMILLFFLLFMTQ